MAEVQKADFEHQSTLTTFLESTQSLQEVEKLKIQTLEKINEGKTRDAEFEVELRELQRRMNEIKGKRASLTKAMQIG